MDFPKSVPSVGLVDGKFIDEDAVAGTPGSLIPSAWGNAVTLEMLKVIEDAGLVPDEDDNTQLSAAIQSMVTEGAVPFASKAEAEEGVVDNKAMSPLRVFQAIAKVVAQATETAFGWLKISTQALVNAGVNDATAVTPKKLAQASQLQISTAFATAGTAAAQTLTPVPAISDYAPNQRFRVKFSQKSNGSGTINVSAKGAKDLKQYDSAGVKVPAVYAVDQLGDIEYDGTDFVLLDQLPAPTSSLVGIQGSSRNLVASATGTSAVVSVTADEVVLSNAAGAYITAKAVNVSASFLVSGGGGIDTGAANSQAVSTWWYLHLVSNGALTQGVLSLNAVTPTLPSGYTFSAMVAAVRIDNTANKFPLGMTFEGKRARWLVKPASNVLSMPLMASGAVGSVTVPTWIAVPWANFAPPMAKRIAVVSSNGSGTTIVAPNNSYGQSASTTNPSPVQNSAAGAQLAWLADLTIESANMYWASNAGGAGLFAAGFEI